MSTMSKKPNVLIFFTDDQRFDTIHAMGNTEISTPNLDKFSKDCIAFENGHIMGGTCGAVCMPSRAMLQTGRDLFSLHSTGRRNGGFIPSEHTTLPEHLRANGYHTHHIGKWHQDKNSFHRSYSNADRVFGFHKNGAWYGSMGGHYNPCLVDFDPTGKYDAEHAYHLDENYEKIPAEFGTGKVHSTDIFCDAAVSLINNYDEKKPLYLYLALVAPHDPRTAPPEFEEMYNSQTVSTPENFMSVHPFDNGELYGRDEQLEFFPRTKQAVRRHIADYYGMISHIDNRFGDVINALKEKGMYDDTIIVFAGDNGLALGQHGLMGKQSVYEHSIRVPLMVKPVGNYTAKHTDAFAYLFDIYPSICDMCGLEKPKSVNGISFAPILNGDKKSVRDDVFAAYRNLQRCYKNHKYKLIEYYVNGKRTTQLFDLENDNLEINNLADKAEYQVILKEMREKLKETQIKYNDPLVTLPKEVLELDVW